MSDPFIIASIALGLSVVASAVRMVDWFLHSDPRVLAKTMRWVIIALALLSVPLLIWLLLKEQWVAATGLLAVMVLLPAFLGRGSLLQRFGLYRRPVLDDSPPYRGGGDSGFGTPDPDLVRRSAAVLEAYLGRQPGAETGGSLALLAIPGRAGKKSVENGGAEGFGAEPMSAGEALEIWVSIPAPGIGRSARPIAACCRSSIPRAADRAISPSKSIRPGMSCCAAAPGNCAS